MMIIIEIEAMTEKGNIIAEDQEVDHTIEGIIMINQDTKSMTTNTRKRAETMTAIPEIRIALETKSTIVRQDMNGHQKGAEIINVITAETKGVEEAITVKT